MMGWKRLLLRLKQEIVSPHSSCNASRELSEQHLIESGSCHWKPARAKKSLSDFQIASLRGSFLSTFFLFHKETNLICCCLESFTNSFVFSPRTAAGFLFPQKIEEKRDIDNASAFCQCFGLWKICYFHAKSILGFLTVLSRPFSFKILAWLLLVEMSKPLLREQKVNVVCFCFFSFFSFCFWSKCQISARKRLFNSNKWECDTSCPTDPDPLFFSEIPHRCSSWDRMCCTSGSCYRNSHYTLKCRCICSRCRSCNCCGGDSDGKLMDLIVAGIAGDHENLCLYCK